MQFPGFYVRPRLETFFLKARVLASRVLSALCVCGGSLPAAARLQEYNTAYGVYWFKVHAPESNAILVVLLLLGLLSAAHFAVLTQRKNEYNSKLIKLVQTNAGPPQGGTLEVTKPKKGLCSACLRDRARSSS